MANEEGKKIDWKNVLIGLFGGIILTFVFNVGIYKQQLDTLKIDVAELKAKDQAQDQKFEKILILSTLIDEMEKRVSKLEK